MTAIRVDKTGQLEGLVDRRSGGDRRNRQLQAFWCQFFKGRRVAERRLSLGDRHGYVDVHGAGLLLIILTILVMCVADAYMTLTLLNNGAVEINPIMNAAIADDWGRFFSIKYGVTACALTILLMHKNYRLFGGVSGQQLLYAALFVYALLMVYEITLLVRFGLYLFA